MIEETVKNLYDGVAEADIATTMMMATRTRIEQEPNYTYVTARLLREDLLKEGLSFLGLPLDTPEGDALPVYLQRGVELEMLNPDPKQADTGWRVQQRSVPLWPQPVRGELSGSMSAGFGEIYVDMPEGERLTGRVTFFTEGPNRKCRGSLVGPSGARLECTADIDRGTGHGVGSCTDERERKFTWHF